MSSGKSKRQPSPGGTRRSRQRKRWTTCPTTGKVRFRDHNTATTALLAAKMSAAWKQARDLPTKRAETRTYRCPDCRGWHLTSQKLNGDIEPKET